MRVCVRVRECVCTRACVRSRFSFDKTPVFRGIISPSPDSNMLCIYGGNKLTCNRQTDNWLKLLLEIVSLISQTELERRRSRSNIFTGSKTRCATHHESSHPVNFDLALTFMFFRLICHTIVCSSVFYSKIPEG